jgi:hypothetical protein
MTLPEEAAPPHPVADALYENTVRPHLSDLVDAVLEVEDPVTRLAVIMRLEARYSAAIELAKTFAVREANEAGVSYAAIGEAVGLSKQRAYQIARTEEHPQP